MAAIQELKTQISQTFELKFQSIKQKLLGPNNERLDFILDSFYKLSAEQRNAVFGVLVMVLSIFVVSIFSLYYSRASSLEKELSDTFSAVQELKAKKIEDKIQEQTFQKLMDLLKKKSEGLVIKPFFEKLSREKNVEIREIIEQPQDLDANDPLASSMKVIKVELRIPQISIPKLLNFIIEIEKAGKYLRVQDLKITGLYGNKLYFEAQLIIRAYFPK